jgi:hypothetical protein
MSSDEAQKPFPSVKNKRKDEGVTIRVASDGHVKVKEGSEIMILRKFDPNTMCASLLHALVDWIASCCC